MGLENGKREIQGSAGAEIIRSGNIYQDIIFIMLSYGCRELCNNITVIIPGLCSIPISIDSG
jgi:hypothetical protein